MFKRIVLMVMILEFRIRISFRINEIPNTIFAMPRGKII